MALHHLLVVIYLLHVIELVAVVDNNWMYQLLHDQGHTRHCPNHVYHPAVVTVDVVDLYHMKEELVVVSKCTNTQDSKTNCLMNRWCLSFGAMIWRNTTNC